MAPASGIAKGDTMLEALVAVYCLGIAAVAIRRAWRDSRFTRRVVVRHVHPRP